MSEKKLESIIRDFHEAFLKGDVEKTLSFFTEEGVWVAPEGTFKGKEELKRFLTWGAQSTPEKKMTDAGIGITVKGNKAVYEYVFDFTTSDGRRCHDVPGICVYEFSGEKIQQHRAYYDRLSVGKQMARGWFEKKVVSGALSRWEKGLR